MAGCMTEDWAAPSRYCTIGSTDASPDVGGFNRKCTVLGYTDVAPSVVGGSSRYCTVLLWLTAVGMNGGEGCEGGMATGQGLGPGEVQCKQGT